MADELTPKQRAFVNEYVKDLNATQAVLRAGYKMTNAAARTQGARLLANANVQKAVQETQETRAKASRITSEWIIQQVAKIAEDPEVQPRDRLKAMELLGKYCGTWDKPKDENDGIRVVIDDAEEWAV